MAAAKHTLRYLKRTEGLKLTYSAPSDKTKEILIGYMDADWGTSWDRKSTTGYVFTIGDGAICWKSRKQSTVALSSTEAEYLAATEAGKHTLWLLSLLVDLHLDDGNPILVYSDNMGSIALMHNPVQHDRTKHIDIRHHAIRDWIDKRKMQVKHIGTAEMTADIFTKVLTKDLHRKHLKGLGLS